MPWNATDALSDAADATRSLLLPFDLGLWIRLAVVALFVGGASGFPSGGNVGTSADGGGTIPAPGGVAPPTPGAGLSRIALAVVVGVVVLLVALALLWALIGAVMEFVLIEGLRSREVRIRRNLRRYLGAGVRLFVFRFVVGLLTLAAVALPIIAVVFAGVNFSPTYFFLAIPLVLLFFVLALAVAILLRLTTDFVVPAMVVEGGGVLDGWRRVWPLLRTEWREFGLYVVVRFVLGIAAALLVALAVGVLAILLALPFLALGAVVYFGLVAGGGALGTLGWLLVGLLVVGYAVAVLAAVAFAQVPVVTFFRYYALFLLGAESPDLDLVGDLRTDLDGEVGA